MPSEPADNPGHVQARAATTLPTDRSRVGEQPGEWVGPYKLLEVIGEGGFGVVWLAERREPMVQRVAIKIIKPGMDSKSVIARFEQERQALAVMDHANIARVFDAGATLAGRPYFVMEYVRGESITDYCDRHRLTIAERLELLIPVCEAVQHAHMKGIIHRDLKPSNILVQVVDGLARSKVIDFGVAKAISHTMTEHSVFTETGQLIGTPEYMSPEQAEMGRVDIDTRTDVYSLGVILYELLVGAVPFDTRELRARGYMEIQRFIREQEPVRPSTRLTTLEDHGVIAARQRQVDLAVLARELKRELEWVPLKAMRKDRTQRYATALDLAKDLRNYLEGLPLEAGPEATSYRIGKFVRRNRGRVAAISAVTLAILVGAIVSLVGFYQASLNLSKYKLESIRATENATAAAVSERAAVEARAEAERERDSAKYNSYVAHIGAGSIALQNNEMATCRSELAAAAEEYRGWEWNYLSAASDCSLHAIPVSLAFRARLQFDPSGEVLLIHGEPPVGWFVIDADSGARVFPEDGTVMTADFAFLLPDKRVLTLDDSAVTVWDTATGARRELAPLVVNGAAEAAVSADGLWLAACDYQDNMEVRSLARSIPSRTVHIADIASPVLSFSSDSSRVIVSSQTGYLAVVDVERGVLSQLRAKESLQRSVAAMSVSDSGHFAAVQDETGLRVLPIGVSVGQPVVLRSDLNSSRTTFSSDDRRVAVMIGDTVYVYDTATGAQVSRLSGHTNYIYEACFSRSGDRLVTASADYTARVWNVITGEAESVLRGHEGEVKHCVLSDDERWVATTSEDSTVRLWSTRSPGDALVLRDAPARCFGTSFDRAGRRIVSDCLDGSVRVWDATEGRQLLALRGHKSRPNSASFSPTGDRILTTDGDACARIWDAMTGQCLQEVRVPGLGGWSTAAWRPDGSRFASSFQDDGSVREWDCHGRSEVVLLEPTKVSTEQQINGTVVGPVYSTDGQWIGFARQNDAYAYPTSERSKPLALLGHTRAVNSIAFSVDGQRFITGSSDGTARVWSLPSGALVATLADHDEPVSAVAISPTGRQFLTIQGTTATVWGAESRTPTATLRGHQQDVIGGRFSPDGQRVVTWSRDQTVRVWNTVTGDALLRLTAQSGWVFSARFSPDGTQLVTTCEGSPQVWDSVPYRTRFSHNELLRRKMDELRPVIEKQSPAGVRRRLLEIATDDESRYAAQALACEFEIEADRRLSEAAFINLRVWGTVRLSGAALADVAIALADARRMVELAPDNADMRNTLGVALYRAGEFTEARSQLEYCCRAHAANSDENPIDWGFLAMALWRVGRQDESRDALLKAQSLAKEFPFSIDSDVSSCLNEAESLVEPR